MKDFNKIEKSMGSVDRSQKRKLGHVKKTCDNCNKTNTYGALVCWNCGELLT